MSARMTAERKKAVAPTVASSAGAASRSLLSPRLDSDWPGGARAAYSPIEDAHSFQQPSLAGNAPPRAGGGFCHGFGSIAVLQPRAKLTVSQPVDPAEQETERGRNSGVPGLRIFREPAVAAPEPVVGIEQTIAALRNPVLDGIVRDLDNRATTKQTLNERSEETGEGRAKIIETIKSAREKIKELSADALGCDPVTLREIKAYLYRKIDQISPYYAQVQNANILSKSGTEAGGRTCNVTSIAMCLEALGKTPADFNGDRKLLASIDGHYAGAPKGAATDVTPRRLPDFLQLVAIYHYLSPDAAPLAQTDPEKFGAEIDKSRATAAGKITVNTQFDFFTGYFGVSSTIRSNPHSDALTGFGSIIRSKPVLKQQKEIDKHQKAVAKHQEKITNLTSQLESAQGKKLDRLKRQLSEANERLASEKQRLAAAEAKKDAEKVKVQADQVTRQAREVERRQKRIEDLTSKLDSAGKKSAKPEDRLAKERQELAKEKVRLAAAEATESPEKMEAVLSLEGYKKSVLGPVTAALAGGKQVIAHMYQHFTRLESLDDKQVVLDDPGTYSHKSWPLSWAEARGLGCFDSWTELEG